ncbi:unnamed protein product [Didymodactylos carnosus]|uniref:Uncharacterized protein n=1 Tax=Didymodactylos carnosus TaxID=1234261 RepID=A0A814W1W2_9BILA|nr:unnamed protein product [Didymodactylos carnosus]CAF1196280.1 unnamed protein product [Didymodactylos carnosus]CAF3717121.1 unnamed protein product [Didymodactylos carnosus]CAF3960667.1 unnamed protein product [Didymodactylos carnosus]
MQFRLADCPDHGKLQWIPTFLRKEVLAWYITKHEEVRWPSENRTWLDYEVRQQRETFRKTTTTHERDVLNEVINTGTQLLTKEGEEVNDDQQAQLQQGVFGTIDQYRTLLLIKLYCTLEQLWMNRKSNARKGLLATSIDDL